MQARTSRSSARASPALPRPSSPSAGRIGGSCWSSAIGSGAARPATTPASCYGPSRVGAWRRVHVERALGRGSDCASSSGSGSPVVCRRSGDPSAVPRGEHRWRQSVGDDRQQDGPGDGAGKASDAAPASVSASTARIPNTIDASPRGPNQPMNATVGALQAAADQRDRHRDHPDDRQAEDGVEDRPQVGAASQQRADERCPEDRPHGHRQQDPGHLAEQLRSLLGMSRHAAEGKAGDERRDEPVAPERHGQKVAAEREGEHGDLA